MLIGTSRFSSAELPDMPAVEANLRALKAALTHPAHGLLGPEHCRVVSDPADQASVGAALSWAVREADDLLLVYYAGHGVLDDDGLLHLGLRHTDIDQAGFSAVPIELVKRNVSDARAAYRVLLLDCCFSGRAISAMSSPAGLALGQLEMAGTYLLTASTKTTPAHAPQGAAHTAFTGALLTALARPAPLTLDEVHAQVDRELHARGLPRPQRRAAGNAGALALVRGWSERAAAPPRPEAPPRPSAPPPPPPRASASSPPPPRASASPPPSPPWRAPEAGVFHLGQPAPAPVRPRRRGAVVAAALAGAATVLLAVSLVKWLPGALGDDDHGGGDKAGPQRTPATQHGKAPSTHAGETPIAASPSTQPSRRTSSEPKAVYRDKRLVIPGPSCGLSGDQLLDLDHATVAKGDAYGRASADAELLYGGCLGEGGGTAGGIKLNDASTVARLGQADPGTSTATACRAAANERAVPLPVFSKDLAAGTIWCLITTEDRVAKLTITKAGGPYGQGFPGSGAGNPTLELTATLWEKAEGT
ncbi:caspase domain-containing protein [Streptomyces sp. NPDC059649]|uniref:caspase family protein n=1 Tax=Streptomyces sp. NPDC059649 TaxID=3346895 RepID=UPI0036954A79